MPSSTLCFWAILGRICPRLSPSAVLEAFGSPEQLMSSSAREVSDQLGIPLAVARRLLSPAVLEAGAEEILAAEAAGQQILSFSDPRYPSRLREIADPPAILYVAGRLPPPNAPAIAVVGAREATPQGVELARFFGQELARLGLVIVSGGARGVDAAAHRGAIDSGGVTIAVRGSGLDVDYPRGHRALFEEVSVEGASVSEYQPGALPRSGNFPRRNRIIAGWSLGTLVVEAGARSGALVTARLSLDQGREVFAVPGSLDSPLAVGTNRLIQQGAKLVSCVEDITEELVAQLPRPVASERPRAQVGSAAALLLASLEAGPANVDELALRSGWGAPRILGTLLELELGGLVAAMPGGRYRAALWGRQR